MWVVTILTSCGCMCTLCGDCGGVYVYVRVLTILTSCVCLCVHCTGCGESDVCVDVSVGVLYVWLGDLPVVVVCVQAVEKL